MRIIVMVLIAVGAVLAGCGGSLKDKIVGTWKIDMATYKMPDVPEAVKTNPRFPEMKEQMLQQVSKGRIEFKSDGSVTAADMGDNKPGKWTLKDNEIILQDEKGEAPKNLKVTIIDNGNRIHFEPTGESAKLVAGFDLIKG